MGSFDTQAKLFKALMHPVRLEILDILRSGEECVCHMEAALGYRQAYISQHLMILRESGLIQDRRDGWNIFYRVADTHIYSILDTIQTMTGKPANAFRQEGVVCPCPHCTSEGEKA